MRRSTETLLRSAFANVLTTVLAGSAAIACGGSTSGSGVPGNVSTEPGGVTPTPTTLCGTYFSLKGVKASPALDGIVTRSEAAFAKGYGTTTPDPELGDSWTASNGESSGTLCASASNRDACLAKVASFRMLPATREECTAKYAAQGYSNPPTVCGTSYWLYTRGDDIGVARTFEERKALFGTIDTVEEALFIAQQQGYNTTCSSNSANVVPDSEYHTTNDGYELTLLQSENCKKEQYQIECHVDYAGNLTVVSKTQLPDNDSCAVAGRRPEGLRLSAGDGIGAHFAMMAQLEAASVTAFRRLHRQLAAFGAPRELLGRIRKAIADEIRHARATTALARKYGVTPSSPEIASARPMSLLEIAIDNAREGCVRETFGALVAQLQAVRAGDLDVRRCMREIADEETEHAALSWDLHAWIETQLSAEDVATVRAERSAAFAELSGAVAAPVDPWVAEVSGIPDSAMATKMLSGLAPLIAA